MNILKSIGAGLAGIIVLVALSIGTDMVLEAQAIFPPPSEGLFVTWMLVLAFGYRLVYNTAGAYVTAALAPSKPMLHCKVLGVIGTVISIAGIFVGWDLSQHWYPIALAVTAYPCSVLGGRLRVGSQVNK